MEGEPGRESACLLVDSGQGELGSLERGPDYSPTRVPGDGGLVANSETVGMGYDPEAPRPQDTGNTLPGG